MFEVDTPPLEMSHLREHGIESMRDVQLATMEADGQISVLRRGGGVEEGDDDANRKQQHR